jgi:hypothetical protein
MCVFLVSVPVGQVKAASVECTPVGQVDGDKIFISIRTEIPPIPTSVDPEGLTADGRVHIRDLQMDAIPIYLDPEVFGGGFVFPNAPWGDQIFDNYRNGMGGAFCTVNLDANLNKGTARIRSYVVLDWSTLYPDDLDTMGYRVTCGFEGNMVLRGTGITDGSNLQCGVWQGTLKLNGYGIFEGAKLNLNVHVEDGIACIQGWARMPSVQQAIPA